MPSTFIAPGVYVREIDLSQYAPALSTSILALVGVAKRGPINKPTFITNELDLINTFGQPDGFSYMLYAAQEYLRFGRQLIIVRVTDGTQAKATVSIDALAQPAYFISLLDIGSGVDLSQLTTVRLERDGTIKEINLTTGFTGPLTAVTIDHIISRINDPVDGFGATAPVMARKDRLGQRIILRSDGEGATEDIRILDATTPGLDAKNIVFGVSEVTILNGEDAQTGVLDIFALNEDTESNGLQIRIQDGTESGTFRLLIVSKDGQQVLETFDNLTMQNIEQIINEDLEGSPPSQIITVDDNNLTAPPAPILLIPETAATPTNYILAGGSDGNANVTDSHYIGQVSANGNTGLKSLQDVDKLDVNIVAVPGVSSAPTVLEALDVCRRRADAFAIVDPPSALNFQEVIDWHNGGGVFDGLHSAFNSSYGATYWPWVEKFDSVLGRKVVTPPSGWAAAQYAFTDFLNDPWFAPAGLTRGRLETALRLELDREVDRGKVEFLYGNGNAVNPIVDFARDGITIWGQRTLQRTPSKLDRIHVRRLLLTAEKIIATATKVLVFDPIDAFSFRRAEAIINPLLKNIANSRGLEDFKIVVDESTNPAFLRNQNQMGGKLFLIPLGAAEKIVFDFIILPSGAEFNEFGA